MKYKCINKGHDESRMFSVGKVYKGLDFEVTPTIVDDFGHVRVIGRSLSFIVRNDFDVYKGIGSIYRAKFEVVPE